MKTKSFVTALAASLALTGAALAQTTTTTTTSQTVTTEQAGKIRTYVMKEKRPSVKIEEKVRVGATLPMSTELYVLPQDVGVTKYRYTVVNDQTVLVDPASRKVIQVIE